MKNRIVDFLKWHFIKIFGKKVYSIKGNIIAGVYEFKGKLWEYRKGKKIKW